MIKIKKLSKFYGKKQVLNSINFEFKRILAKDIK